ncbi:MAG: tetratricopeptide repeat protein, partial [Acidobacteria bacterium]|nr:tetratricopeptide repeat protein [Acidobacteriota bacterium]
MGALARNYEEAGDLLKAEGLLRRMVKREPNNEQLRNRLNSVLEQQGKEITEPTATTLAGMPVEIPGVEAAAPPPPPEAVDDQARMVKEALENSDLFSRYGLVDKAVAELEKVLAVYPEQTDIHQRIFEVCQRTMPERAKQAGEALARILESRGDVAKAKVYGGGAGVAEPSRPAPVSPPAGPSPASVELDISDVFATPVQEEAAPPETPVAVEVPFDLAAPVVSPPAAQELDLSADFASFGAPAPTAEETVSEGPTEQPSVFPGAPATQFNFDEARGEVDFYLSQGFVDEARASVATLEERFPGEPKLAMLRQLIEDKVAPTAPPAVEITEAVSVGEPRKEPALSVAPPAPRTPAKPVAPPAPPAVVEPPPAAGGDLLGDLAGDLAAGLEGIGEPSPPPGQGPFPTPGGAGASNEASPLSGLLDELGDSGPSAAGQDDPETHYNLGVAFREMGLYDEAIGEFQKVVKGAQKGH